MKNLLTIAGIFLLAGIFFKILGPLPLTISQTTTQKSSTFDVSGEGSVSVIPDEARANFGITTSAATIAQAQNKANDVTNKLKVSLQALGIKDADIRTTNYSINPDYTFDSTRKINGYTVSSNVQVAFKDFSKLNSALDAATNAGANQVGQLSFELSDEKKQQAENDVRKKAIDQAKAKAQRIASVAGISLGKVINVIETPGYYPPIYAQDLRTNALSEKAPTQVSPGTSEVKVNVILSFETH